MTAQVDLRRLLDDVAMRATRIEIVVDARLEQSVQATVHTDRHGDATVAMTRYAADSAAEALEAVLVDAARWSNAQPSVRRPIRLDTVEPVLRLAGLLRQLNVDGELSAFDRRIAAGAALSLLEHLGVVA